MEKEYLTVQEAAKGLGLTTHTVRQYISDGLIERTKIFNSTVIAKEEVERYKKQRDDWFKSRRGLENTKGGN